MPASRKRVPELDDAHWLRMRYLVAGDLAIANELGVDRKTVRAARRRHGIASHPVGPRRGVARPAPRPVSPIVTARMAATETAVADRIREDRTRRTAATEAMLAERLHALHDASQHHDTLAYEDALLDVAATAALIWEHKRRLRSAA